MTPVTELKSTATHNRWKRASYVFGWMAHAPLLSGLLCLTCFLALIYLEENWRGKKAWQNCKAELESRGVSMNWKEFIPAPVPDDLNAFSHPSMSQWFSGRSPSDLSNRLRANAVFASASGDVAAMAEVTVLPLNEHGAFSNANLVLDYRKPVLSLATPKQGDAGDITSGPIPLIIMDDVPLMDAIRNLARHSDVNFMIDQQVSASWQDPEGNYRYQPSVTLRWENVTAFQALITLLHNYNLEWVENPRASIGRVIPRYANARGVHVVASAEERIRGLIESCAYPDTNNPTFKKLRGAMGDMVLFANPHTLPSGVTLDRSEKPRTAQILVRADTMPSTTELEDFFRGGSSPLIAAAHSLKIAQVGANCFRVFANPPPFCRASDYLACTEQFEDDFNIMREAVKLPFARLDGDYGQPFNVPIPNYITIRIVSQTLAQRAQANLLLNNPEAALRDLTLVHDLAGLLENKPTGRSTTLVAAMIRVSLTGLYTSTIADGFRLGAWQEPQLHAIQELLQEERLVALVADAFAAERVNSCHSLETISADRLNGLLSGGRPGISVWTKLQNPIYCLLTFAPRGWVYQNMVVITKVHGQFLEAYDPATDRVHPEIINSNMAQLEKMICHFPRFYCLAGVAVPNAARTWRTAAQNQTHATQAYIVCALERYRISHGSYPPDLFTLVPDFAKSIPRDVITGELPAYCLTADGHFLLYSVGWNQTDEGGVVAENINKSVDLSKGDWVWPHFLN